MGRNKFFTVHKRQKIKFPTQMVQRIFALEPKVDEENLHLPSDSPLLGALTGFLLHARWHHSFLATYLNYALLKGLIQDNSLVKELLHKATTAGSGGYWTQVKGGLGGHSPKICENSNINADVLKLFWVIKLNYFI